MAYIEGLEVQSPLPRNLWLAQDIDIDYLINWNLKMDIFFLTPLENNLHNIHHCS